VHIVVKTTIILGLFVASPTKGCLLWLERALEPIASKLFKEGSD
jgi:hypothetical protein